MAAINEEKGPAGKYQKLGAHSAAFCFGTRYCNFNLCDQALADRSKTLADRSEPGIALPCPA